MQMVCICRSSLLLPHAYTLHTSSLLLLAWSSGPLRPSVFYPFSLCTLSSSPFCWLQNFVKPSFFFVCAVVGIGVDHQKKHLAMDSSRGQFTCCDSEAISFVAYEMPYLSIFSLYSWNIQQHKKGGWDQAFCGAIVHYMKISLCKHHIMICESSGVNQRKWLY